MTRYYRRKKTGWQEDLRAGLVAGSLAAIVAGASFYLVRVFLSREALVPEDLEPSPDGSAGLRSEDQD